MLTLTGKYNFANVMIDNLDSETQSQIYSFLNHPAFADTYIAIMPDTHAGAGAVIGFTAKVNKWIIPNVIGVDIGCGVLAINIGYPVIDFEKLDNFIKQNIPSGFSIRNEVGMDNAVYQYLPNGFAALIRETCSKTEQGTERPMHSLGTLGGGNHFIEIDHNDATGEDWLLIHSGSRNFGKTIAEFHQKKAREQLKEFFAGADAYKGLEYLPMNIGGTEYLSDMRTAQEYAHWNRVIMAKHIVKHIFGNSPSNELDTIDTIHNYISTKDNIIRKGAVSAYAGERLVIPFNMRDGTMVCTGKGSKKWNFSAPHGAGRIMSRRQAKDSINIEDFTSAMTGIYTTTATQHTIDESPMVYKDKDTIIEAVKETVDVNFFMRPVYNFKAGGE